MTAAKTNPVVENNVKAAQPEDTYSDDLRVILEMMPSSTSKEDLDLIEKAFYYAYEAHRGRQRYSKEHYIVHCIEVAKILAELHLDPMAIAGGLLHDVVEDTNIPLSEITKEFGEPIGLLVDGVTKISSLHVNSYEERQAATFRKMLLSMSKDIRVILIKFADRIHNMRTIEYLPPSSQERIARETIEVYAPLAHRFGIAKIKSELEDLSFKVLDHDAYREIASLVAMKKEERSRLISGSIDPLQAELKKFGVQAEVQGRAKHFYSIYNKIRTRGVSFDEILDLLAIRILVEKVEECYFVLGVVHNLWTPLHEKFADYIAMPKSNMYQSLHTKVRGTEGRMLEIQIRTRKMHSIAEEGIAAHWAYKEQAGKIADIKKQVNWVRSFLDLQEDDSTPKEFMDTLRDDLFSDEVFAFSPRGKVITLPQGATTIDFAFAVHTDVGIHCIGAKVNKKIVPLNTELQSGDTVEIITSKNQKPSQDWLRYVVSARAKSKIKRWLKESQLEQYIKLGNELFTRELNRVHMVPSDDLIKDIAQECGYDVKESFFASLGNGDLSLQTVINRLNAKHILPSDRESTLQRMIRRVRRSDSGIKIQGLGDMMIRFAECCRPLPGDKVTGFVTKGKGVTVHRVDCKNARFLQAELDREVPVEWDVDRDQEFNARVQLLAEDRRHLLRDITGAIAPLNINMIDMNMRQEGALVLGTVTVKVKNLAHLTKFIRKVQDVKGVVSVSRVDEQIDGSKDSPI
ncbi:bifunctional (p)ppGpp synthetase/guanosine-3',5'-bis(diphosphate) 3'-pyrophosphohydrolase [bacterium]|nr:bifunctional (p)ppGpp synthetase/guanosine-3',5'-bis(diphosphate) 3'-pyrophosphohydrolase [bacterium]MBU1653106.1 bifunctional (p)ppGpp synthetase/guanosine-3',5'-bis(diphosphate) 3'-pyrophosphohydrolase [bacterium]MBU1881337.1 bifunctional (p)ppGpp synthetase/guanosine-3',5'-bis(diphosphate) 3'-pyrophosphohydrolase [bacterium]